MGLSSGGARGGPAGVLITGASGFVGRATLAEFESAGHRVTGTSTTGGGSLVAMELEEPDRIGEVLGAVVPEVVVHLAGFQSVRGAWEDPAGAFRINTGGTAALLRAIERSCPATHLILVSSAAVYGDAPAASDATGSGRNPLTFEESNPLRPESPYGASKAAAEILAGETASRTGLAVTVVRLFNQIGADQPASQVPAGFAASIAGAEADGESRMTLEVGNPEAARDYTDTRDTARALRLLAEGRVTGTLNVCSGTTHSLVRVVEGLAKVSETEVEIETAPERANRNDVAAFGGSPERLEQATGWQPEVSLDQSLSGLLEAQRAALRG